MAGSGADANETAATIAADAIRRRILQQRLMPGMHVRQDELATELGMSRVPIREALKMLSVDGLVTYEPNRGYFVTQLSRSEMLQLYWLRETVEDNLINTARWPTAQELADLEVQKQRMKRADITVEEMVAAADAFHFAIFALSPKHILAREVKRWWAMSTAYRALSISIHIREDRESDGDHDRFVEALSSRDRTMLLEVSRRHRETTVARLLPILPDPGEDSTPGEPAPNRTAQADPSRHARGARR
ncbi:GntR family transcriptional regulator [Dactylosporangium sp. CA-152071]|uniref:GntR family transcriptional regulator n=1 Tax=Dactylosporangium sp. CA-152071 TaxID=3239933 RepID=UPI003D8B484D